MGACLFRGKAKDVFVAGDHQSTFAGNPLACAAGLVVLETVTDPAFLDRVNHAGDYIRGAIASWNLPIVKDVRGRGLMIGADVTGDVKAVVRGCIERGALVLSAKNRVRLTPALNIPEDVLSRGLDIVATAAAEAAEA